MTGGWYVYVLTCSCCSDPVSAAGKTVLGVWPQPASQAGMTDGPARRLPVSFPVVSPHEAREEERLAGHGRAWQQERSRRQCEDGSRDVPPPSLSALHGSVRGLVLWASRPPILCGAGKPGRVQSTAGTSPYCVWMRSRPDSGLCNGHQSVRRWGQQTPAQVAQSPFCPRECEKRLSRSCGDGTLV